MGCVESADASIQSSSHGLRVAFLVTLKRRANRAAKGEELFLRTKNSLQSTPWQRLSQRRIQSSN
jgi:hypothetical protein